MARIAGHLLALILAWDFYANARALQTNLRALVSMRQLVIINPSAARTLHCKQPILSTIQVSWRESGLWQDVCKSSSATGSAPRYWRIEAKINYRMLFLSELPITFAIILKY